MPTLSPDPALGSARRNEADPFEDRRLRAGLPDAARGRRRRGPGERKGGSKLGWKTWLAIDLIGLILFLLVVVVWPPLGTCRTHGAEVGFYAGDSVEKCTRRGIAERLDRANQRIKMFFRGSGR